MTTINLDGSSSLFDEYPALEIIWHKASKGTYCHSACLVFDGPISGPWCKVSVKNRMIVAPSTKEERSFDMTVTRYLPYKVYDGRVYVPLNSFTMSKALGLCEYTPGKKHLVNYTSAIEFSRAETVEAYPFIDRMPPLLISKELIDAIPEGEKVTVHINLSNYVTL